MIDVTGPDVLTLHQACKILPCGRNGSRPHFSTLLRWVLDGVRVPGGRVKLEAVRLGDRWITTREALNSFAAATTPRPDGDERPTPRTPTARRKAVERAEERLEKVGI